MAYSTLDHAAARESEDVRAPSPMRDVILLSVAALLVVGQLYLVLPLFPDIASDLQVTTRLASWTLTAFGIGYAVGFLVLSPLSARFGHRRTIVSAITATALLTAVLPILPTISLVIGFRVLQGFAGAALAPTAMAYLTKHVAPPKRPLAFTILTSSFLAAAVLAQVYAQVIVSRWDWRMAFVVGAVLLAVMAVLARLGLRADEPAGAISPAAAYRGVLLAARDPKLLPVYLSAATLLFGLVGLYTAIQLANPLNVAADPAALLALRASALPAVVVAPFAMHWLARVPAGYRFALTLAAAALFIAAAALSVPLVGSATLLALMLGGFMLAGALAAPSAIQAVTANAGGNLGGAVAMYSFWLYVGSSAAAPVATALGSFGFTAMTVFFAAVLALGAAVAVFAARAARFPRPAQPSPPATSSEP